MQDCEYTENSKTILYLMEQFAKGKRELLDLNNTDVFHMYSSTDFSKMSGAYKHVQHKNMLKNFRQYVNIKKQAHLCQTFYKKNYKQILQDPKSQFADSSHNISAGTNRSQIHVNNQRSKRSVPLPFLRSKRDASAASRSKRDLFSGWLIFPGTKWCGTGDIAENIHDLGYDESTDTCCRKHDHCPHLINRFSWKYNMFNYHFHTMSLCVCDNRFRRCLRRSESPTAKLARKYEQFGHIVGTGTQKDSQNWQFW
ncbi:hypothetical protein SNE40_003340 [Patella caerulea]|uniref:Phospholipase A2-like central domain-containing protein n=1 Tax=Patella caerulea TaxID=87958 RepID=A0AAN8Q053_PATCE